MDFRYTEEEEKFRKRLGDFLDRELTEDIARQNWEESVSCWRGSVGKWQSMNSVAGKASSREPIMPGPRTS